MSLTLWFVSPHRNKEKTLWSIIRDKNGVWFCFPLTREEYWMTPSENSQCNALRIPNSLQWPCCTVSWCSWTTALMWAAKEVSGPAVLSLPGLEAARSDLCPRDSFQELSVPGLNWIIIQTLPALPASRIWIISNRELLLKDATEPPQQMNPKLWQRHRVSPETVFSMISMTYLWMTRMPNGQNKPNPTVLLGVFICNTQNTIQYIVFSW